MLKFLLILAVLHVMVGARAERTSEPRRLTYGVASRITSLDPYLVSGIDSYRVTGFVLEPLARIEPFSQELKPALAESWKVNVKSKTISVGLRSKVKFHDGSRLAPEDVRFTWQSFLDPKRKGEVWRGMWADVEDVRVTGPDRVEFRLKEIKYQTFRNIMTAFRILPRNYYRELKREKWAGHLVGTGPYRVEKFEPGRNLLLAVNPDWWGWKEFHLEQGSPLLIKSVPDAAYAEQAIKKGELDIFEIQPGQVVMGPARELKSPFGRGFSLTPNFKNRELSDARVRRALALLWNRKAVGEKLFGGLLAPAVDSFTPSAPYYPKGDPLPLDPVQARKILGEAGYGREHPLNLKVLVSRPAQERWVGMFQTDAAQVGVKIDLERVTDESQWWQLVNQGKFDLLAIEGSLSEAPHTSVFHSKGAYNSAKIEDRELDFLLDKLDSEFDPLRRGELNRKAILRLREIVFEIPGLFSGFDRFLLAPEVTLNERAPLDPWWWRTKVQQSPRKSD